MGRGETGEGWIDGEAEMGEGREGGKGEGKGKRERWREIGRRFKPISLPFRNRDNFVYHTKQYH